MVENHMLFNKSFFENLYNEWFSGHVRLQSSGKRLKKSESFSNVDYSTLQRGHQYFMESYIPGRHIRFCCNDNLVRIQACCYRSQKKNDSMHELKIAISSHAPHHVVKAFCTCTAGSAGMCSHIVGLLKQLIHYVLNMSLLTSGALSYSRHGISPGLLK